jgi:hypothetical protein
MDLLGSYIVSVLTSLILSAMPAASPPVPEPGLVVEHGSVMCADGQEAQAVKLMPSERYSWVCP